MSRDITNICYSPGGTTAVIADLIATAVGENITTYDLMKTKSLEKTEFAQGEFLVVTMPVFAGRLPEMCADVLKGLKGNNTPAIAAVVYGNRDYDDALLELTDILADGGFAVQGACALIARHSIFPQVAADRPDENDKRSIQTFATVCAGKAEAAGSTCGMLRVPGDYPYKEIKILPLKPTGNENCIACGACVEVCPVRAIVMDDPTKTDVEKCITCTACIYACPTKARGFFTPEYAAISQGFAAKNSERKEYDFFFRM